jgi:predicted nucleotidyltransferase
MKYRKIFGDMFILDNLIFRIYDNYHPKGKIIAYPIYSVKGKHISKLIDKENILKKYLTKIGENIFVPTVDEKKVKTYLSCFDFNRNKKEIFKKYSYVEKKLNAIGIKNIGLTGSNYLRTIGFLLENNGSDLDIIVFGKRDSILLENNKDKIFDSTFMSYKKKVKKIYLRRKNKSTPFFIDMKTAREFESIKTIGVIRGTHVNITPTYKMRRSFNFMNKNLGMINVKIKILNTKRANSVPGFYKIRSRYKKYPISELHSNFFFYLLGAKRGDVFNVRGNLIMKKGIFKKYYLELNSWGNYKEFIMNKLN